jgi:hypothetical protein
VIATDTYGGFTTSYAGQTLAMSYTDSGSNGSFFSDPVMLQCAASSAASGYFCPTSTEYLSATIIDANNASTLVNFSIANAATLFTNDNGGYYAFSNLGGPSGDNTTFDWGITFFFGKTIFTAFNGMNAGGVSGPFIAY